MEILCTHTKLTLFWMALYVICMYLKIDKNYNCVRPNRCNSSDFKIVTRNGSKLSYSGLPVMDTIMGGITNKLYSLCLLWQLPLTFIFMRVEVFMVMTIWSAAFWVTAPCIVWLACSYHLYGNGGSTFLQSTDNKVLDYIYMLGKEDTT
jgi:hypothetical protein